VLYLEPNVRDSDGTGAYVHFTEADMPLVVSIGEPRTPALDATPETTRRAAIDGFRAWQPALQRVYPWFALEFHDDDPDADIRVEWTRRPRAHLPARGEIGYSVEAGALKVRGRIQLSAQPIPGPNRRIPTADLRVHAMHAFGRALGLVDCSHCDSMLSLAWRRRDEFLPTDLDIRTFEALTRRANGVREDGRPLAGLGGALPAIAAMPPEPGLLADLPFINTGRGGSIEVDIAADGRPPFVVTLDTGAGDTVMTSDYARALGISVRSTKTDPYVRATTTGVPIRFWVMGQQVVGRGRGPSHFDYALLGGEFLKHFVVELDFARRRVRFLDPAVHSVGDREGEHVIELRIDELRPYAELELGSGKVWALIDTGAESPVAITEEKAAALDIAIDPQAERIRHVNVLATSTSTIQSLPEARLGGLVLSDVPLQIALADESSVRVGRWLKDETLIGTDLLRNFVVRFDYQGRKLGLTPITRGSTHLEDATPGGS
jgi:predicted aspartyl protease